MHAKGQDSFKTKDVLNIQSFQEKKINFLIFYHLNSPTLHCISVCVAYHAARLEQQQQENEQNSSFIQVAQYGSPAQAAWTFRQDSVLTICHCEYTLCQSRGEDFYFIICRQSLLYNKYFSVKQLCFTSQLAGKIFT